MGAGGAVPVLGPGAGGAGDWPEVLQAEIPVATASSSTKIRVFMAFTSLVAGLYSRARNLLLFRCGKEEDRTMKWTGLYLLGYFLLLGGILLALWKFGILASIGTTWIMIGLVIAIGIGIMVAVANSGEKKTIEVDRS